MTDSPEAFAAYQRGLALLDAALRVPDSPDFRKRIAAEFERAVALDSTFTEAWGHLAAAHMVMAYMSPGDRGAEQKARTSVARAVTHAPADARAILSQAFMRLHLDGDTVGSDQAVQRALATNPNDASTLSRTAELLSALGQLERADTLLRRAATLDPRSGLTLLMASSYSASLRQWPEARRFSDALLALDSTDERGSTMRLAVEFARGDTLALAHELKRALARVPHPSNNLLFFSAYVGGGMPELYLALSPRELGVSTLLDSLFYYEAKADLLLRRGEEPRAHAYYDSMRVLVSPSRMRGAWTTTLLQYRVLAEASTGDVIAARRTVPQLMAAAKARSRRADLADVIDPVAMAAVFGRLGDPESAVRWLEAGLNAPTGWTARGYRVHPKLLILRGTPAFKGFLSAHPD